MVLRKHQPMSSTPLSTVVKPLMSQKVQKTAQSPTFAPSSSMVFRQPSATSGQSHSPEAIPNQWSSIEDLAHGLDAHKGDLNGQNLAIELNYANHRRLTSSDSAFASTQQSFNPIELETLAEEVYHHLRQQLEQTLETLAEEVYHHLRQRLEIDRERHGFHSGRLPW